MKTFLTSLIFILLGLSIVAQEDSTKKNDLFDSFQNKQNDAFSSFQQSMDQRFEDYQEANQKAFNKFKEEVSGLWGDKDFKSSSRKNWVEYSDDKQSRTDVDFENEVATIEVLMTPEEVAQTELYEEKIKEQIENLVSTQGSTLDYKTEYEEPEPLSEKPVMEDQFINEEGETVDQNNAGQFAEEIIEKQPIETKEVKGEDEEERVIVSVKIPLAPNSIQKRASRYLGMVGDYSTTYELDPALVLAIIHTESYFNPKAKSWVPAFGLMQIVPKYAGKDAYKHIYKKDKLLNANYLYDPENNIELGTCYLHILDDRWFKKVENPINRLYCCIASYNTGAGNVSRAFIGTTKLPKAIPHINAKTPEEVYLHLHKNLNSEEGRNYIKKVRDRMELYKSYSK